MRERERERGEKTMYVNGIVQYSTVHYNTVQYTRHIHSTHTFKPQMGEEIRQLYSTLQYSTVQYSIAQLSTV